MRRISIFLFAAVLGVGAPHLANAGRHKAHRAHAAKPKAKKRLPIVTGERKKALAELYGGFKFGMTKDQVLAVLRKQIDERFEDKIKATTDVAAQDRLRRDKKVELARVSRTYVSFDGKRTGWDVSIIENEFAHHTNESMMERWENQGGKNQRRFFFFYNERLWKMFVSLDVSILPEDKKNFDTFKAVMLSKYGPGDIDGGTITWRAGDFDVRAIDRLRDYDALGLAIEDPKVREDVLALRKLKAPPPKQTSPIINAIIDKDNSDHPDVLGNKSGAVDAVIKAQGGK